MTRGALARNRCPAQVISINDLIPGGQFAFYVRQSATVKQDSSSLSEPLALSGNRHSGIVNMDQAPAALFSLIDLCFPAVGGERGAIFSELGGEIPIELGPGCIPVNMNGNVVNTQFALRKGFAHQTGVDILLNLFETVFVAQRVDQRNVR